MTKSEKIQRAADIARANIESAEEIAKIQAEIAALPPETKRMMAAILKLKRQERLTREARSRE